MRQPVAEALDVRAAMPAAAPVGTDASDRAAALEALLADVARTPWSHDFFALLRRVESLAPASPRIGRSQRPLQDALRLGQEPELDFAPAAVVSLERSHTAPAPRLGVRLFGLLGPNGPMPLHLTEYVRERLRHRGDATSARFLDVFHHRLLSLFYRAWADAQPSVQHDRPAQDRYAAWLGSSCGVVPVMPAADAGARAAIPDRAQLYQAGLLGARSRHPEALAKLLGHYFALPVRVQCHVHHVLAIDAADRTRLGHARRRAGGQPLRGTGSQLGRSATIGSHAIDRQSAFRVVLGPLPLAQYQALLPGDASATWDALCAWIRLHAGLQFVWDVELRLAAAEQPPPRLGRAVRLGLTAWLGRPSRPARTADGPRALRLRPATSFVALAHPPPPPSSGDPHG